MVGRAKETLSVAHTKTGWTHRMTLMCLEVHVDTYVPGRTCGHTYALKNMSTHVIMHMCMHMCLYMCMHMSMSIMSPFGHRYDPRPRGRLAAPRGQSYTCLHTRLHTYHMPLYTRKRVCGVSTQACTHVRTHVHARVHAQVEQFRLSSFFASARRNSVRPRLIAIGRNNFNRCGVGG